MYMYCTETIGYFLYYMSYHLSIEKADELIIVHQCMYTFSLKFCCFFGNTLQMNLCSNNRLYMLVLMPTEYLGSQKFTSTPIGN